LEKSQDANVDNETKLKLYSLFKQSTQGQCTQPKPGITDFVGRAKWQAWSQLGQMSKDEAQNQYVQLVNTLVPESTATSSPSASANDEKKTANRR